MSHYKRLRTHLPITHLPTAYHPATHLPATTHKNISLSINTQECYFEVFNFTFWSFFAVQADFFTSFLRIFGCFGQFWELFTAFILSPHLILYAYFKGKISYFGDYNVVITLAYQQTVRQVIFCSYFFLNDFFPNEKSHSEKNTDFETNIILLRVIRF